MPTRADSGDSRRWPGANGGGRGRAQKTAYRDHYTSQGAGNNASGRLAIHETIRHGAERRGSDPPPPTPRIAPRGFGLNGSHETTGAVNARAHPARPPPPTHKAP